ncbi:ABC transporter ATP-binding protein [Caldilinea sp.]|uniref:ABC transporter ATP-binding protein n=1 Tax=Caldilinea sp. TaxID=2293560 RepID=UPI002C63C666|nr:ABC transporter ATP-binding protein [Caldilinea sp.]
MSIIELRDASKNYHIGEIETRALDGVSLTVEAGEFTALVGPSGSGKTTMLQIIGCLDKPDRGLVLINGQDVTRLNANRRADLRREVIGFIFQFFALVPVLDAYENVELPLLLNGVNAKERRTRALEMLDAVGLSDRVHHRPDQLSGGQQQRVAIARALAPRPLMVLADEPTANLDTANGEQAMEIMKRLNEQTGTAFIFATHDPRVMSFARRTVKMLDGRIVENSVENGAGH